MRDDLLRSLGARPSYGAGCFEYIALSGENVHLCFVALQNQQTASERLSREGTERQSEFSSERYAASCYVWTTGRVLSDTDGVLAAVVATAKDYPDALRAEANRSWSAVWAAQSAKLRPALMRDDRIAALTAFSLCTEASLRALMASARIHCNPIEPKWLPEEIAALSAERGGVLAAAGALLPSDMSEELGKRYENLAQIWSLAQEQLGIG